MNNFIGAVKEYFTIDEKPRLHRKNTWFEDHLKISEERATDFLVIFICVAMGFVVGLLL